MTSNLVHYYILVLANKLFHKSQCIKHTKTDTVANYYNIQCQTNKLIKKIILFSYKHLRYMT